MSPANLLQSLKARLAGWSKGLLGARDPGLELVLGGHTLCFDSPSDFAFAIVGRTGITPTRIQELQRRPQAELHEEAQGIANLEQRLRALAAQCAGGDASCAAAVAQLGVAVFSKDHDWRLIFTRLVEPQRADDAYVRVALDAYLTYLDARRELVKLVLESRPAAAQGEAWDAAVQSHATVVFNAEQTTLQLEREHLRRLPPGEAVSIKLAPGKTISLKLARHEFALSHQRGWTLVAGNGKRYTLREGINSVGRGRDNDVPLDADFRNVSRKHLLAEPLADDVIVLTDVSSHGTYVPPTALAS